MLYIVYFIHKLDAAVRSLQKVQGHRAGVDVDVTPLTGGPVWDIPQSGDPV